MSGIGRFRAGSMMAAGLAVLSVGLSMGQTAYGSSSKPTTSMFGAVTPQEWPVLFEVNTSRSLIKRMQIVLNETCSSGHTNYGVGAGDKGISVKRSGSFSDSYTNGPLAGPEGVTFTYSDEISGKFNSRHTAISGTWHEVSIFKLPDGTTDTCDSGTVHFTAVD